MNSPFLPTHPTILLFILCLATLCGAADDGPPSGVEGITLSDPNLQAELLDTHPDEFFLSHDMDLKGQLYLGCREALFVYGRTETGGFQPRKELYRFPKDTWVYDLEAFGDDLLVLTNTALYRLYNVGEENSKLEKILWGNPLGHHHQGLHGIEFAPDGDLLIVMGDPHPGPLMDKTRPDHLWLWTWYVGPENRPVPYAGVGAVMRLDLETYDFSVYASGLRNPCGISFDRDWNLFANDNDQESTTATPGRLISVPEHSWNGWARGWDSTQSPARVDMIPNVNWATDVPVGQGYYDHTTLGEEYRGSLFVSNWGSRSVSHHPIKPKGAGFRAKTLPFLLADGIRRPVSAMPTNDGRLVVALSYMKGNAASPACQTDLLLISPRKATQGADFDHSNKPLIELLSEPIQLRAKAHRQILQGGTVLEEAAKVFVNTAPESPAFSSLVFLAAAHGDAASIERITSLSRGKGRVASLAWSAAAAWPENFSGLTEKDITTASQKDDPILLVGLLKFLHSAKLPIPDSVAILAAHRDPFVRQSAAILLARHASNDQLAALAEGTATEQLASTLATVFRIWQRAEVVRELREGSQVASAKNMTLLHPEGTINLQDLDAPVGVYRMADWWRNTEVRSALEAEFDRLKNALSSPDKSVASAAATGLFFLNDERIDSEVVSVLGKNEITLSIAAGKANKEDLQKALLALKGAKLPADTAIPEAFQKIDWDGKAAPSGDAARGKKLFIERGCIACHLTPHDGTGGTIGPTLVGVGERFLPSYLAASILVPNLDVSPNFHPNTVTMKDGTIHTGFARPGNAPGMINLQLITGLAIELNQNDIAKQDASEQSLMPAGLVQTPEDMAHLIAYMCAIHPKPGPKKKAKQTAANTPPPAVLKAGLTDWETTGNWGVDGEGAFVLRPRPGEVDWTRYGDYLWSQQPCRNFEITFEYKHEEGGNSGFYFNVSDRQQAVGSVIEVQIRDSSNAKKITAHSVSGGVLPGIDPKANAAKPAGEWNSMKVRSLNGVVKVTLNGQLVNQLRLTHPKLAEKPKEGYFGFQDHGLPFWLRDIRVRDLSALASTRPADAALHPIVEDPLALEVRRRIDSLGPNTFRFPPTEAKHLRVDILGSSKGQPCIDELEAFSGDSTTNLAQQSNGAKASASSLLEGHEEKHRIEFLNDGKYGNTRSWIPAERTGWAQIEFPKIISIDRVVLSRDRGGNITGRTPISFDILVSVDGKEWKTVKKVRPPEAATRPKRAARNKATVPPKPKMDGTPNATTVNSAVAALDDTGFTSIFDGKNLDQWDHIDGAWEIVDGTLSCTGKEEKRNWIIWRGGTPSDFVLRLEFNYQAGNSGVQVRSDDLGDHQVTGYQVEIAAQDKMGLWHHSLLKANSSVREVRHLMATAGQEVAISVGGEKTVDQVAVKEEIVAHYREEGWNTMEVIAEGNTLTQKINGVVFSKVTDEDGELSRRAGVIALQDHGKGCLVAFRNIRIKQLLPREGKANSKEPAKANSTSDPDSSTPNIVLILADDFGWGDASCNNPDSPLKTPAIDRIAKEGIRFTNAHTPSAVCTPTRYGLLTGRYPWRSYLKKEVLPYYAPAMITAGQTTVASYLKSQGYRTGGFGKWHLGLDWTPVEGDPMKWRSHWNTRDNDLATRVSRGIDHTKPFKNSPIDIGFDTYFGTPSNAGRLPFFIKDNRVFGNPVRNKKGWPQDPDCARDQVDDIYVAKAIGFMETHQEQHANRPFFVYLPLNAIHGAVKVPKRFAGENGMTQREDKILWANESVGKITAALDRMKLTDDTLLIFTTDNGPINSPRARQSGHLPTGTYRGLKTTVWDGGTRVPFVARWPGHIPAGAKTDQLIGLTDVLATIAALCGDPLPDGAGTDSVNQLPALLQHSDDIVQRPELVTASYRGFLTIRQNNWKAVFGTKWTGGHPADTYGGEPPEETPPDDPATGQLYNLSDDPYEQNDLWESQPEVVERLRQELDRIQNQEPDDSFPTGLQRPTAEAPAAGPA